MSFLKKASSTVRIEKRDLRIYRYATGKLFIDDAVPGLRCKSFWLSVVENPRAVSKKPEDIELIGNIERMFGEVDGVYGSPKIHAVLRQEGFLIGKNRVACLMQENGLKAHCSRIYRCHAKMDRFYASIRNEIHELEATGPDQIWVGDVTYLRVNEEWRYLAMILDKYSRRVVGWSLSRRRNVDLTLAAFKRAARKRLVQSGLYFHSDRGAEYVATKYRNWLKGNRVIQSMNRKGVMNDNAEMESFFHQFKAERIH